MCQLNAAPTMKKDALPSTTSSPIDKTLSSTNAAVAAAANSSSTNTIPTKSTEFSKIKYETQSPHAIIQTLSFVWLALCTSLVVKHNDMVIVFYSFVGSFLTTMATLLLLRGGGGGGEQQQQQQGQAYGYGPWSLWTHVLHGKPFSSSQKSYNGRNKSIVGIVFCIISFLHLGEKIHFVYHKSPEFLALANISGFLAFDLWYDQVCCCRQYPPRILLILGDALTLSVFSVLLSKWDDWDMASKDAVLRPLVALWLGYKMVRLGLDIVERQRIKVRSHGGDDDDDQDDIDTSDDAKAVSVVGGEQYLWTIHGKDYDLSDFVERHPGGKEAILLGRGRDCTALFESYHPFTNRHRNILKKYTPITTSNIGSKASSTTESDTPDQFYEILKQRVNKTLVEQGIDPNSHRAATVGRTIYYFFLLSLLCLSGIYHIKGNPLGSFMFAIFGWLVGCLGHDAGHFAASRIPLLNDAGVWGISFLCNPIMWQHQHTFAHHSHTNDFDHDPDLHHFDVLLRVHRNFKQKDIYKYQKNVLYVIGAYALVVFGECIKIPLGMMKTGSLYDMVEYTDRKRPLRAFGMYFHYVSYLGLIVVSPFFSGKSWMTALSCALIHIATAGWLFALFSQINHLNEYSIDTQRGKTNPKLLSESWAARQVATSNNFATKSLFWHVFSNGLNMQIEHHLFPGLNHCHLHLIQPTVQRTCEEFGVHYKSFESWSEVMVATLNWLDKLSDANE